MALRSDENSNCRYRMHWKESLNTKYLNEKYILGIENGLKHIQTKSKKDQKTRLILRYRLAKDAE